MWLTGGMFRVTRLRVAGGVAVERPTSPTLPERLGGHKAPPEPL